MIHKFFLLFSESNNDHSDDEATVCVLQPSPMVLSQWQGAHLLWQKGEGQIQNFSVYINVCTKHLKSSNVVCNCRIKNIYLLFYMHFILFNR